MRVIFSLAALAVLSALPLSVAAQARRAPPRDFAYLGVYTEPVRAGDEDSGLRVIYVAPGSAAGKIGLEKGDEIIALNDILIDNRTAFVKELRREKVEATIRLLIRRNGERLKLKGKIGSYLAHQKTLRKRMYGKPLPPLPPIKWWDAGRRKWVERQDGLAHFKGNISILFGFDDCPRCTKDRYRPFTQMKAALALKNPKAPLALAGLYQSDSQDEKGETARRAQAMFEKYPSQVPVGRVFFPDGTPRPEEREKHLYIHNHGMVVLDTEGKVRYLQVFGLPREEFLKELEKLLQEVARTNKPAPGAGSTGTTGGAGR